MKDLNDILPAHSDSSIEELMSDGDNIDPSDRKELTESFERADFAGESLTESCRSLKAAAQGRFRAI